MHKLSLSFIQFPFFKPITNTGLELVFMIDVIIMHLFIYYLLIKVSMKTVKICQWNTLADTLSGAFPQVNK